MLIVLQNLLHFNITWAVSEQVAFLVLIFNYSSSIKLPNQLVLERVLSKFQNTVVQNN